ncbi:MAG: pilus assembly FimT family protein [Gammaproteobacteria bacterium]
MKQFNKQVKKQQGFTIIELVVVILLLGILTATALPRFMDVTDDAHAAVVDAVVGGFATGTSIYRAQWFADGQPNTIAEYNSLLANTAGYPIGLKTGATITTTLLTTVGTSANCVDIFQNVLQPGGQPTILAKTGAAAALAGTTTLPSTASDYDFVAYLDTSTGTTKNVCHYIYTGQYTNNTLNDLPVINYNARTGSVTETEI